MKRKAKSKTKPAKKVYRYEYTISFSGEIEVTIEARSREEADQVVEEMRDRADSLPGEIYQDSRIVAGTDVVDLESGELQYTNDATDDDRED